ncbi:MAG: hypothetical protein HY717_23085 [Planctomycetes bacterium]|nr:hypothetical protein [Planctomycetota bacterium]
MQRSRLGRFLLHHKPWKRFRRDLLFYLALPFLAVVSRLPLSLARTLGLAIGTVVFYLSRAERRIATENLTCAFGPSKSAREIRKLCRRVFQHTFVSFVDFFVIRRWSKEKIERNFHLEKDFRRLQEAIPDGSVGITAHFGNWELLAIFFARYHPGTLVPTAQRGNNHKVQEYMDRIREAVNLEVIFTYESPRRFFQVLNEKKLLGLLPDQDLKIPNGVFVDFFGRPAYTSTLPVKLSCSTGLPLIMVLLVREGKGFRLLAHTRVHDPKEAGSEQDSWRITQRWSHLLADEIRACPEQWMWFHRRWDTQPGEEKRFQEPRWVREREKALKG